MSEATLAPEQVTSGWRARRWWRRYGLPAIGICIIFSWLMIGIFAPLFAPYNPYAVDVTQRLLPPSAQYLLGTDELGRDVLSRIFYGARVSLLAGLLVVGIGAIFGTLVGSVAAYAGRASDMALMRLTDLVLCFPPIILAMAIAAALGIGTLNTIIGMSIVWWPKFARLARSLVLQQLSLEYVEAATVAGFGSARILLRHIIPNAIAPLVVLVTLDVGHAILTFAGLSFLGLGVVPPTAEWGSMVSQGRQFISQWWVAGFPGFAILTVVLGFNFLGDGVRDWLDPKEQSSI